MTRAGGLLVFRRLRCRMRDLVRRFEIPLLKDRDINETAA